MEHTITSNLSKHLNKHNILYELQLVFRGKLSCETQLIQLVGDLGLGKQNDLILLDFTKALDKVNHLKLLYKLSCFCCKRKHFKLDSGIPDRSHSNCCTGWGVI